MRTLIASALLSFLLPTMAKAQLNDESVHPKVETAQGWLEGRHDSGVRAFLGIPFAQPPVGALRWVAPQPPASWEGTRQADTFGPRCMQRPFFSDMMFRSNGMSEDCLYLNVWTPARSGDEKLPVLVYFYGGGLSQVMVRNTGTTAGAWRAKALLPSPSTTA